MVLESLDDIGDSGTFLSNGHINAVKLFIGLAYILKLSKKGLPVSKFFLWFKIVSMATAVFPVCLSPMMSSLCPLPTGTRQSTALSPVYIGSWTDFLGIIPGALISTLLRELVLTGPRPSMGLPSASNTRPNISIPMGTSTMAPVLRTTSPSWISLGINIWKLIIANNLPVVSEDDDSDVVGFEIEGHASDSTGELDHFSGLDLLEPEDSGDSVSNADHSSVFLYVVQLRDL